MIEKLIINIILKFNNNIQVRTNLFLW